MVFSAAIGTTAWVAWVSTDGAVLREVRFTITAVIVAMPAFLVQRRRGDLLTYLLLLAGVGASSVSGAVTLSGAAGLDREGSVAVGLLIGAAVGYLLAGRTESATRRDTTNYGIAIGSAAVLFASFALPPDWRLAVALAGLVAAAAALSASRPTPRSGLIAAMGNVALAVPLSVSWLPWVRIIDAIPVPVMAIVGGSTLLIALSWATNRILSPERGDTQTDTA